MLTAGRGSQGPGSNRQGGARPPHGDRARGGEEAATGAGA